MTPKKRITKRGEVRWVVRFRCGDTIVHRTFATKGEADAFIVATKAAFQRGIAISPRAGRVTVVEVGSEWLELDSEKRPKSRHTDEGIIRREIEPFFGNRPVQSIRPADVQRFVNGLSERFKTSTVRRYYAVLHAQMAWAVENEYISRSPCRGIKVADPELRARPDLKPADVVLIAEEAGPPFDLMILLSAVLGLRFSECVGLLVKDLDLLRGHLSVARAVSEVGGVVHINKPKSKAARRTLAIPPALTDRLAVHLARRGLTAANGDELVFVSQRGGVIRYSNFRTRVWLPAVERAGYEGAGFHDLRRTAATSMVVLGVDMKTAATRLGHSDVRLTLGLYAQPSDARDQEAAHRLDSHFFGESSPEERRADG
jgi:integrase